MPAVKTLALAVLSVFSVAAGLSAVALLQSITTEQAIARALSQMAALCREVAEFGGARTGNIVIPAGFSMGFADNRISIDGREAEVPAVFAENLRPIPGGEHRVTVESRAGVLVVSWT
jgi:hypothetical protein